ncbi:MAG: bifunctional folylpolyglutamate synthase/dihydrofolate synthase [Chloroflexi bacterium]|nr:bifunctional folylpolyglutamate synthase/dihydrofolate synthase [Chloroflexota bacterium]
MNAAVPLPATAASSILPWRLPTPDSHSSRPYWSVVERIYGYSETHRTREELARAQQHKLDRMRALLQLVGTPQASFSTILVAGTKGKGSMAALLSSILTEAGYRVGRYTQPHLYSYRERTWAAGDHITEQELADAFEAMDEALDVINRAKTDLGPLTTFDVGTALSLLHFARTRVQLAVVEVGVGGLNDATNALEPLLGLIGPVGMDHIEVLGHTLAEIAAHKIGIARRNIDIVVGRQEPEAAAAIQKGAADVGARTHELGGDVSWKAAVPYSGSFDVTGPLESLSGLETPLVGRFQRDNASLAVAAAQLMARQGWPVSSQAIRSGLRNVHWPGRFQTVVAHPLTIVDGAHNPTSARALAVTIGDLVPSGSTTLVLGITETKDLRATLEELAPVSRRVILTTSSHPRARPPEQILPIAQAAGMHCELAATVGDAVLRAWELQPADGATIVTGSLFLVGDALEWLWQLRENG